MRRRKHAAAWQARIKRLVRFLAGLGRVQWEFKIQSEDEASKVEVYVDSDWAGCRRTRRSTSDGVLMVGRHPLRASDMGHDTTDDSDVVG